MDLQGIPLSSLEHPEMLTLKYLDLALAGAKLPGRAHGGQLQLTVIINGNERV